MAVFDVQVDGRTFSVNTDDYPSEHTWILLGDERGHYVCTRHRVLFQRDVDYKIGPDRGVWGMCVECMRPPKMPADIERPDYWRETRFGQPTRMVLQCTYHPGQHFELDEACRRCLKEDEEADVDAT